MAKTETGLRSRKSLTTGSISSKLIGLSAPMTLGIVAALSTTLVDAYFVGRLGTEELAALSFSFPVAFSVISAAIGLSAGAASVVSRAIGAGDCHRVRRLASDSLLLALAFVLSVATVGFLTIEPLFGFLGARGEVLDYVTAYMQVWYLAMAFLVVPMVANALIRANGDAVWPSVAMVLSSAVNIVLTPALIYGWWQLPSMHIAGAAMATLFANVAAFFLVSLILTVREKLVSFDIPAMAEIFASWREIARVAVPASAGSMIGPASVAAVTGILARHGTDTVAAFGAATRIESFACIPMLALSAAIGPVAGQNFGACKYSRVVQALRACFLYCGVWTLVVVAGFWLGRDLLARQFSDSVAVQAEIAVYLVVVSFSVWGYGVSITAAGCFNAIGRPLLGLGFYLVRCGGLYVPLVWLSVVVFEQANASFIAISVANVVAGLIIAAWASDAMQREGLVAD